jgi:hypothetical protein
LQGANLNSYGYISHGVNSSGTIQSNMFRYNDSANTWSTTSANTGQVARAGSATYTFNGYLWTTGGYKFDAPVYTTSHARYNDVGDSWTTRANYPVGAVNEAPATGLNGYGYCGGNVFGQGGNYWRRYNDALDSWATRADRIRNNAARTSTGDIELGGYCYVVTGRIDPGSATYTHSEQYNDSADSWIIKASISQGNILGSCASLNGYLWLVAGSFGTIYSFTWLYNDSLNNFGLVANDTSTLTSSGSFAAAGYGYCAGGDTAEFAYSGASSAVRQYN